MENKIHVPNHLPVYIWYDLHDQTMDLHRESSQLHALATELSATAEVAATSGPVPAP